MHDSNQWAPSMSWCGGQGVQKRPMSTDTVKRQRPAKVCREGDVGSQSGALLRQCGGWLRLPLGVDGVEAAL